MVPTWWWDPLVGGLKLLTPIFLTPKTKKKFPPFLASAYPLQTPSTSPPSGVRSPPHHRRSPPWLGTWCRHPVPGSPSSTAGAAPSLLAPPFQFRPKDWISPYLAAGFPAPAPLLP